jgi:hypothetical protein
MSLLDVDWQNIRTLLELTLSCPPVQVHPLSSDEEREQSDNESEVSNHINFAVDQASQADDEADNNIGPNTQANVRRRTRRGGRPAYVPRPWPRRRRRWPVRPLSTVRQRQTYGVYDNLLLKLRLEDPETYQNYLRVSPELFDEIVTRIAPRIQRRHYHRREPHSAGLKLAITLRYMATGDSHASLAYNFRIPRCTVCKIIPEVCDAIKEAYVNEVINLPSTADGWKAIAQQFEARWNLPHALGAVDGKHIRIRKPRRTGSLYYNYKNFFSVVLLAVVDSDYRFMYADVGGVGHQSDCQLFNQSSLSYGIESGRLNLPPADPLPNDNVDFPYFFLGDDAFPLRENMMKPYSTHELTREQRVFNYRISRGWLVVENAFGILAQRWQCFLTPIKNEPSVVHKIVHAAVCLHNLIRIRAAEGRELDRAPYDREDAGHNIVPGAWREGVNLVPLDRRQQGMRELEIAKVCRQTLQAYFNSEAGSVPWQHERIDQRLQLV